MDLLELESYLLLLCFKRKHELMLFPCFEGNHGIDSLYKASIVDALLLSHLISEFHQLTGAF